MTGRGVSGEPRGRRTIPRASKHLGAPSRRRPDRLADDLRQLILFTVVRNDPAIAAQI